MKRITKIPKIKIRKQNEKLRVAAYARVSTSNADQLLSLDVQKAHYEKFITSNPNWEYVGTYYDKGLSGAKVETRSGLISLINDSKEGLIDLILTKSISRFSRNTLDCLDIVRNLMKLGVHIKFEKENISTESMESELKSISENEKWSIKKRFKSGNYVIASPPYGYKNVDGKLEIVEEEAKIIREIFDDIYKGKSANIIAKNLNERKVKTKRGGKWTSTLVIALLRNEKFVGDSLFQKTYTDNNFKRHKNLGEKESYLIENSHDAIITRDLFARVSTLLDKRSKMHGSGERKFQNKYPYTSKLICNNCLSKFKRQIHYQKNKSYVSWICNGHIKNKNQCDMKYIKEESINAAFMTMINKLICYEDIIIKPVYKSLKQIDDKDMLLKIKDAEDELSSISIRRQTLSDLMTSGILDLAVFTEENNKLIQEEKNLKLIKEEMIKSASVDRNKLSEFEQLSSDIKRLKVSKKFNEEMFNRHIENVVIFSREELQFRFKCGLEFIERM